MHSKQPAALLNHPNLKAFKQHGFIPKTVSGNDHIIGNCIFCNHHHFFINVEKKMWDCKSGCGRSGGYKTFIMEVISWSKDYFTIKKQLELGRNRGLRAATLRKAGIGYNPLMDSYLFPIYDINNKNVLGLKLFWWNSKGKKFRAITEGGHTGCIGWDCLLNNDIQEIWIVEGEWDYLTLSEIFFTMKIKNHGIIALPGATQFKDEIVQYFKGKTVHVILHNDPERELKSKIVMGAGYQGMIKIYNKINSIVKTIDFVHWKERSPDGFDLRDLYNHKKNDAADTFKHLQKLLKALPPKIDMSYKDDKAKSFPVSQTAGKRSYEGKGVHPDEVYTVFRKWLHMKSMDLIDVTVGCIIGNRFPHDPIWLQIVGPSGSAKSVICEAIDCHYDIEAVDTFTASTLVSGSTTSGGADPSLLLRLHNRILVTKDLTTILEMPSAVRDEIFGQLRSAFDGHYTKGFGNGTMVRTYNSHFGFIAGVTPAIELYTEGHTALGERFIRFNIPMEDIYSILMKMESNLSSGQIGKMKIELKTIMREVIDFDYKIDKVEITEDQLRQVMALAELVECLRGTVIRDRFSKEITHKAMKALPTRLFMQLRKELTGITAFKRKDCPDKVEMQQVVSLARSTVPLSREYFLREIIKNGRKEVVNLSDVSKALKLPSITCQRQAETLCALGVLDKAKTTTSLKSSYKLTDCVLNLIEKAKMY